MTAGRSRNSQNGNSHSSLQPIFMLWSPDNSLNQSLLVSSNMHLCLTTAYNIPGKIRLHKSFIKKWNNWFQEEEERLLCSFTIARWANKGTACSGEHFAANNVYSCFSFNIHGRVSGIGELYTFASPARAWDEGRAGKGDPAWVCTPSAARGLLAKREQADSPHLLVPTNQLYQNELLEALWVREIILQLYFVLLHSPTFYGMIWNSILSYLLSS